jgi:hypothetical protein
VHGRTDLEDVEHLERGEALSRRGQLEDVVAVIAGRNGLHPLGLELGQIGEVITPPFAALWRRSRRRSLPRRTRRRRVLDQPERRARSRIADEAIERREARRRRGTCGWSRGRRGASVRGRRCPVPALRLTPPLLGDPAPPARTSRRTSERAEPPQQGIVAADVAGTVARVHAVSGHRARDRGRSRKNSGVHPAGAQPAALSA